MAPLKTHLLRALENRHNAMTAHLAGLQRKAELQRVNEDLAASLQPGATVTTQQAPPSPDRRSQQ